MRNYLSIKFFFGFRHQDYQVLRIERNIYKINDLFNELESLWNKAQPPYEHATDFIDKRANLPREVKFRGEIITV